MKIALFLAFSLLASAAYADPCKTVPISSAVIHDANEKPLVILMAGPNPNLVKVCAYPDKKAASAARAALLADPVEKYRRFGKFIVVERTADNCHLVPANKTNLAELDQNLTEVGIEEPDPNFITICKHPDEASAKAERDKLGRRETQVTFTGDTHNNKKVDNLSSMAAIRADMLISGDGVPAGTRIVSVNKKDIELSRPVTSLKGSKFTIMDQDAKEKFRALHIVEIRVSPDNANGAALLLDLKAHVKEFDGTHWATEKEHKAETSPYLRVTAIAEKYGFHRVFVNPPDPNGRDSTLVQVCKDECEGE